MDRGNARQARIVRVQSGRYRRQPWHEPINAKFARWAPVSLIGTAQQPFDLMSPANDEMAVPPLNQRRVAKDQAIFGTAKAEIVLAALA